MVAHRCVFAKLRDSFCFAVPGWMRKALHIPRAAGILALAFIITFSLSYETRDDGADGDQIAPHAC